MSIRACPRIGRSTSSSAGTALAKNREAAESRADGRRLLNATVARVRAASSQADDRRRCRRLHTVPPPSRRRLAPHAAGELDRLLMTKNMPSRKVLMASPRRL